MLLTLRIGRNFEPQEIKVTMQFSLIYFLKEAFSSEMSKFQNRLFLSVISGAIILSKFNV